MFDPEFERAVASPAMALAIRTQFYRGSNVDWTKRIYDRDDDTLVDLNTVDMDLSGPVTMDVARAIMSGEIREVPVAYENHRFYICYARGWAPL